MVSSVLAAVLLAAAASGIALSPVTTRVYSDVCSGDNGALQGTRIVLIHGFDGDIAVFQHATAGPFDSPSAARANVNARTGAVSFAIRSGDYDMSFAGSIAGDQLRGTLHWRSPPEDDDVILSLAHPRERVAICRPGPL